MLGIAALAAAGVVAAVVLISVLWQIAAEAKRK